MLKERKKEEEEVEKRCKRNMKYASKCAEKSRLISIEEA